MSSIWHRLWSGIILPLDVRYDKLPIKLHESKCKLLKHLAVVTWLLVKLIVRLLPVAYCHGIVCAMIFMWILWSIANDCGGKIGGLR